MKVRYVWKLCPYMDGRQGARTFPTRNKALIWLSCNGWIEYPYLNTPADGARRFEHSRDGFVVLRRTTQKKENT